MPRERVGLQPTAMNALHGAHEVHRLDVRNDDDRKGAVVSVRIHGRQLARHGDYSLYAAEDGSVLVYDERDQRVYGFERDLPAPAAGIDGDGLRWDPDVDAKIIDALGAKPGIDIGAAPPR